MQKTIHYQLVRAHRVLRKNVANSLIRQQSLKNGLHFVSCL